MKTYLQLVHSQQRKQRCDKFGDDFPIGVRFLIFFWYISTTMMRQPTEEDCSGSLRELCEVAEKIHKSASGDLEEHLRYYINFYVQHKKSSEEFFICLCEHAILNRIFTAPPKTLSSLAVLELFHLLISNSNKANDLVYIFSQPIVHEWLFERFSIYREREDTIEYYVQLLKTIILKASSADNDFLIKLFCNKRFPSFPLLTVVTVLGVSEQVDELVKITAQQCVLLLINLINSTKTGLVYLNELQMVVYFYQFTRQMFCEGKNQDLEGSIKYFIDLTCTLKNNQTSLYLLYNLLVNTLYFKSIESPAKIIRFIRELRQHAAECKEFQTEMEGVVSTLFRIFCKYYCQQYVNFTYFNAQRIIPAITILPQPKLIKFYSERCRKIDDYLVNEGDYQKSEKGNECLIEEWLEFNNCPDNSPARSPKKNAFVDFFSSSEVAIDRYIRGVMTMAGLEVEKLKSPIIKLTFSSNFKTSLFLAEAIVVCVDKEKIHEEFYKDACWKLKPSEELFIEVYLVHLLLQSNQNTAIILEGPEKYEGQSEFLENMKPALMKLVAEELCEKKVNQSKNYLLLLLKLIYKFKLGRMLDPELIEGLLGKLFDLQKQIGEQMFIQQSFCSFLRYILKNQEQPYMKEKISAEAIKNGKFKYTKPKKPKLEHLLFHYQVIQRYLDPSLKALNEFVEDYWRLAFGSKEKGQTGFSALMAFRDAKGSFLEVYPTERFDFQIRYRSQSDGKFKFALKETDFLEDLLPSALLSFSQFKGEIRMQNSQIAMDFRQDVSKIRETRQEIFRQAILEYMPFIYDSIEVRYRNHRPEYSPTPN